MAALLLVLAAVVATASASTSSVVDLKDSTQFSVLLLGDWGGMPLPPYTMPGQVSIARVGMPAVARNISAQAVFALGDNFYSTGVTSDTDARFRQTFDSVYTDASLNIPWFVVEGNHDHKGNASAQIDYTNLSTRWKLPYYYYAKTFTWDSGKTTMDVVFIDTVLLSGNNEDLPDPFGELQGPADKQLAETQWQFIEYMLNNSTADYLWVAGHYPVWSGCSHGPTTLLVQQLKPMLEKYNASGYFSGHDHCLEHIDEGLGPKYVLSGAGDNCCYKNSNADKCPANSIKFAVWDDGHGMPMLGGFASFVATSSNMVIKYHSDNGTTLYTTTVAPRKRPASLVTM